MSDVLGRLDAVRQVLRLTIREELQESYTLDLAEMYTLLDGIAALEERCKAWQTWERLRMEQDYALAGDDDVERLCAMEAEARARQRLVDLGQMPAIMAPQQEQTQ